MDDDIWEMITTHVTMIVREAITEVFGSIKTTMIKLFEERYAIVTEAAATATIAAMGI